MRAAASRRVGRRNAADRRLTAGPDVRPARKIDFADLGDAVARAHSIGRRVDDLSISISAILAELLPTVHAGFGFVADPSGRPIASASGTANGLNVAALERPRLLETARSALGGEPMVVGGKTFSAPLSADGSRFGAMVLRCEDAVEASQLLRAGKIITDFLAGLFSGARAGQRNDRSGKVAQKLVAGLARHQDGVALFSPEGRLSTANAAFAAAHGARQGELRGLTLEDILTLNDDGLGPVLLARDLRKDDAAEIALGADGRWLRLARTPTDDGGELVFQSFADDAFSAAANARSRVRDAGAARDVADGLWRSSPVGVLVLSKRGRIEDANGSAALMLRAPVDALIGRRLGKAVEGARDKWAPVGVKTAGGDKLLAKARPLSDGRSLIALIDPPAEPGAPAAAVAAAPSGSISIAELGHEMRTPLNAIIGFSDVLLARSFGPLNDRQSQYLSDVGAAGRHMLEMVDNMLDHAQLSSGKYPFDPEWFAIGPLIEEATRYLGPASAAGGVELSIADDIPDRLQVNGDRRGLMQALINLLTNGVKFTPEGGSVTASVGMSKDGGLSLTVTDTGEGIPAADLARVMQPFTQVRRLGSRPLKGAGLGLSIVRAVAELHDGKVEIASREGEGARISIVLPAIRVRETD